MYKDVLDRRRRLFGEDHPKTLMSMNNYGHVLYSLGRYAESEPYYKQALERRRRVLGEDDPDTMMSYNNYATVLNRSTVRRKRRRLYRKTMDSYHRRFGDDHPQTLTAMNNVANILHTLDRSDEAADCTKRCWIGAAPARRRPQRHHVLDGPIRLGALRPETFAGGRGAHRGISGASPPRTGAGSSPHHLVAERLRDRAVQTRPLRRSGGARREAITKAAVNPSLGPKHPLTKATPRTTPNVSTRLGRHAEAVTVRKEFGLPEPTTRPATQSATKPVNDRGLPARR